MTRGPGKKPHAPDPVPDQLERCRKDKLFTTTVKAFRGSDRYAWVACRGAATLVGKYEVGAVVALQRATAKSNRTIYAYSEAWRGWTLMHEHGVSIKTRNRLYPKHFRVIWEVWRQHDHDSTDERARLADELAREIASAAAHGTSSDELRWHLRTHYQRESRDTEVVLARRLDKAYNYLQQALKIAPYSELKEQIDQLATQLHKLYA